MTTVAKLVARSLRMIQVINPAQAITPQDMETGIEALNAMMQRWEADLLSLGWTAVSNPSDVIPIPVEAEQAVAANLAMTLAPEYGVSPMQTVASMAIGGMNDLLRDQAVATPIQPILDVPAPQTWNNRTLNGSSWYVG